MTVSKDISDKKKKNNFYPYQTENKYVKAIINDIEFSEDDFLKRQRGLQNNSLPHQIMQLEMRRTHLRGQKKVETDVGIMFMTMNLKKYGANKKVKPLNFHFKNKKHRNSLKIMNFCVFISGLKIEFLPRHFPVL